MTAVTEFKREAREALTASDGDAGREARLLDEFVVLLVVAGRLERAMLRGVVVWPETKEGSEA